MESKNDKNEHIYKVEIDSQTLGTNFDDQRGSGGGVWDYYYSTIQVGSCYYTYIYIYIYIYTYVNIWHRELYLIYCNKLQWKRN